MITKLLGYMFLLQTWLRPVRSSDDLEGLVNYALNVEGVEVGILLKKRRMAK